MGLRDSAIALVWSSYLVSIYPKAEMGLRVFKLNNQTTKWKQSFNLPEGRDGFKRSN